MKEKMEIIFASLEILKKLRWITPKGFIPEKKNDFIKNMRDGNIKNFRFLYPFYIWGVIHFPETWWKTIIMIIATESITKIITPFVDKMFKQRIV